MRFPARLAALALIATAVGFASCVETKNATVVNPDGAAKITIDALLSSPPGPMGNMGGGSQPAPEAKAKKQANDFLGKAKGVDAWKDVTIDVAKDGRTHVKATAYVSNLSSFRMDMIPPVKWTSDGKGGGQLQMTNDRAGSQPASRPQMTDEEIANRVKTEQQNYQQMKPMFQMILGSLKIEATYELPGTITEANIFTKTGASSATLVFEGKKLAETIDKIMSDDKKFAQMLREGRDLEHDEDFMFEGVYGKKGPAIVKVTGSTKPLFDYKAEATAAKDAQPAMLEKLGIDLKPAAMRFGPASGPTR